MSKLRAYLATRKQMRQALPIAAEILSARILAQAQGYSSHVDYNEIAHEAYMMTTTLNDYIKNGGSKGTN